MPPWLIDRRQTQSIRAPLGEIFGFVVCSLHIDFIYDVECSAKKILKQSSQRRMAEAARARVEMRSWLHRQQTEREAQRRQDEMARLAAPDAVRDPTKYPGDGWYWDGTKWAGVAELTSGRPVWGGERAARRKTKEAELAKAELLKRLAGRRLQLAKPPAEESSTSPFTSLRDDHLREKIASHGLGDWLLPQDCDVLPPRYRSIPWRCGMCCPRRCPVCPSAAVGRVGVCPFRFRTFEELLEHKGLKRCGGDEDKAFSKELMEMAPWERAAAATAIGRLGTLEQTSLLTPLLKDPDSGVRFKAKRAIEYLRKDAEY